MCSQENRRPRATALGSEVEQDRLTVKHYLREAPVYLVAWIVAGLIANWLAGTVSKSQRRRAYAAQP
jgi:hypothetical protein